MAANALGGGALPFNIPAGIDALKARDRNFWPLYATWRAAEDDFEAWPNCPDECLRAQELLDYAEAARAAMLETPVRTAAALSMKVEALRGHWGSAEQVVRSGFTIGDLLQFDVERIAKFEIFGADAFQDMGEG